MLSGRFAMFVDRGAGPHKIMEWREGDVMGCFRTPASAGPPGDSVAQEPSEILAVHRDHLRELIRECHEITSILVHAMVDRARAFTSSDLHDEKMISLGKLSAGLAHELNNPASAIERSAALLEERLEDAERATRALGAFQLTEAQLAAVDAVRAACLADTASGVRSPIEQAEREEAIADWLADHGLDMAIAETLADTAVTSKRSNAGPAVDGPALECRAAVGRGRVFGAQPRIGDSGRRDADLGPGRRRSKASRTWIRPPWPSRWTWSQGLGNTVTVLRAKARAKSAAVVVDAEPGLPRVRGFAGELNQIWANLIDNALDADPRLGPRRGPREPRERRWSCASSTTGLAFPPQIRERIFDPFFTTKPVGQGTGLGLDIVRRLVRHNDGEISVESQPGRTEFRVALPLAEIDGAGGSALNKPVMLDRGRRSAGARRRAPRPSLPVPRAATRSSAPHRDRRRSPPLAN